jgi:ATP-dependent RNA helicase DeaD
MTIFSELGLPPALADAIAARGYEQAMPVQVAVMEEANRDRDLLVSSQTGSGKTLAFGALLARMLLESPPVEVVEGDDATAAKPVKAHGTAKKAKPTAGLVIAPTRELANQVCAELTWLFAKAKIRVAAFTGGSDMRRELKILGAGVDVVVGTPGRLVDHLSRGALQLEGVQAVVLDEADEMLDMGFREDLETLLSAATGRKRTHMFSATLPRPIMALAARYQKDAVRVDARKLGEQGAGSHEDIHYDPTSSPSAIARRPSSMCFGKTLKDVPSFSVPPATAWRICTARLCAKVFVPSCFRVTGRRPSATARWRPCALARPRSW